ncbi:MAG: SGNH/GDSL hydrolase family protein [Balneolaceae bacterium]
MVFYERNSQLSVLILLLFLFFTNCEPKIERSKADSTQPISYLALGDSYTIGTGIEAENSWPMQLSDSLSAHGVQVDTTLIIATNGWTTSNLKNGIATNNPNLSFDLVSLLIGVNNQYQGLNLSLYRTEFRELLEQAIYFAGNDSGRVIVISIPNYGVTPFAKNRNPVIIRQEIEVYNDIAKNICAEYEIPFINITLISEKAADDLTLLAADNLHPSEKMYAIWIKEMLPEINKILE